MKKILLLALVVLLILAFFILDLDRWLTLDALKQHQAAIAGVRAESPWLMAGGFFLLYVLMAALSLPGAAVMTLAAGALFGIVEGLVLVSFASSLGATLAFLVARFLLREQVQGRFGNRLQAINRGIEKDGAFYLFTLRLVPVFPFFVINLVMGLTPLAIRTFYWVSQLGMLPGTLVYVNAGTQLAAIEQPGDILSPMLLGSFALLGLFPWLARLVLQRVRRHRALKGHTPPRRFDRNLIVIGAGAAGLVSSYIAATVKARVTLIEAGDMGGDCLNTGCVPSKALIKSARVAHQLRHADRYGLNAGEPSFSFTRVMARVGRIIDKVAPHDSVERYTALGVEVVKGYGRLVDPWTVEIITAEGQTQRLSSRSIIIAAGAEPLVPNLPGLKEVNYLTSDTLWQAMRERETPPARLLVLGGGPIGCELAQAFARLGSRVVLVQRNARLMPKEDSEVSEWVKRTLVADGVQVLTGCDVDHVETNGTGMRLHARQDDSAIEIDADTLLLALGRRARLAGYGLQELGIPAERTIDTNEYLETLYPNIYAAGDVAGPYQFTHTAAHMAWYASVNALFGQFKRFAVDYRVIPWCTFVDPEVARVGLNEQEAKQRGLAFDVTRFDLEELDRAITDGAEQGFIKVLTEPGRDRILGVTIVAEHAGELLAEYVLAMKHNLGLNKILGTIHVYPTLAEANKYAAGEWKRAHAPERLLAWLARYHSWRLG
ncbi:FAD-dependent oxidoreductase [Oceanimonas sp. MB9]|uniref:FAD-dependent oxidoreductase n=1 Tax=Oceanimonas sp. MB9 TaxID=2588453 RepID=UPI0013F5E64D|nr:bifunctional TVP38/TMEM64 family protein/FAD-dependent oxidoreductase [Oceanimonas sp. MB9]NHI01959.1 Mercuric reductase [Oceanimonas sp. MB9]